MVFFRKGGACSPPALLLLLLLVLLSACSSRPQALPLTEIVWSELASNLQVDPTTLRSTIEDAAAWDSIVSMQRRLDGKGFHKTLHIQIAAAAPAGSVTSFDRCLISLLQPLPSSIFADPYQLEDLTRSAERDSSTIEGYAYSFQLLGPLDLELPAPACQDTALLLQLNTTWQQLQQQAAPGAALLVPLHAKYPQPYAAGYQGWRWSMTGHVAVQLPWPYLLVDCRQPGGAPGTYTHIHIMPPPAALQQHVQQQQQCKCRGDSTCSQAAGTEGDSHSAGTSSNGGTSSDQRQLCDGDERLLWLVPAGNLQHEALVSWGTLLVTAVCCLAVSWTALKAQT